VLETVTVATVEVDILPVGSMATTVRSCEPLETDVESQVVEYGFVVSVAMVAPSTLNLTLVMESLSVAVEVRETADPDTVALFRGASRETVGEVMSVVFKVFSVEVEMFPAVSADTMT
jgi:hypothetical protein